MLIESVAHHLPVSLAILQGGDIFHPPQSIEIPRILLRWLHFLAGITWIGLLYFFNLINVPFQKTIDADTKRKVNPELLLRSLWWFRWGALITVLVGLAYYASFILSSEARNAGENPWILLLIWLVIVLVTYAILYGLYQVPALTKDGRVLAVVIAILVIVMSVIVVYVLGNASSIPGKYLGNKSLSIGVGGGIGILMLLNVWGVIWPAQKRILAATREGTAADPVLARKAFLASRTNTWLSLPMLLFMGTSHGDWIIFGK